MSYTCHSWFAELVLDLFVFVATDSFHDLCSLFADFRLFCCFFSVFKVRDVQPLLILTTDFQELSTDMLNTLEAQFSRAYL